MYIYMYFNYTKQTVQTVQKTFAVFTLRSTVQCDDLFDSNVHGARLPILYYAHCLCDMTINSLSICPY